MLIPSVDLQYINLEIPYSSLQNEVNLAVEDIVITGEFDNWRSKDYHLQLHEDSIYRVQIPVMENKNDIIFKFQINGNFWTTLGLFKVIQDFNGYQNNVIYFEEYKEKVTTQNIKTTKNKPEILNKNNSSDNNGSTVDNMEHTDSSDAYINISSNGELSSIEDVHFEDLNEEENVDETLVLNPVNLPNEYTSVNFNADARFKFELLSKRVKTFFK